MHLWRWHYINAVLAIRLQRLTLLSIIIAAFINKS